jgi:translation initiation factor IF-2
MMANKNKRKRIALNPARLRPPGVPGAPNPITPNVGGGGFNE